MTSDEFLVQCFIVFSCLAVIVLALYLSEEKRRTAKLQHMLHRRQHELDGVKKECAEWRGKFYEEVAMNRFVGSFEGRERLVEKLHNSGGGYHA